MTDSDWGPDSPATTRFRAFYDWPAPVEFDAELPDDIDGPDDEREFLIDAAPFARQRAVRVEAVVPASAVAQGATNPQNPDPSATPSGNDGSGRLRAEVARALGNAGVSPFEIEDFRIEDVADRLHRAGFRLVSDDEATVDRVAAALAKADGWFPWDQPADADREVAVQPDIKDGFRAMARAAVRALREAGQ